MKKFWYFVLFAFVLIFAWKAFSYWYTFWGPKNLVKIHLECKTELPKNCWFQKIDNFTFLVDFRGINNGALILRCPNGDVVFFFLENAQCKPVSFQSVK